MTVEPLKYRARGRAAMGRQRWGQGGNDQRLRDSRIWQSDWLSTMIIDRATQSVGLHRLRSAHLIDREAGRASDRGHVVSEFEYTVQPPPTTPSRGLAVSAHFLREFHHVSPINGCDRCDACSESAGRERRRAVGLSSRLWRLRDEPVGARSWRRLHGGAGVVCSRPGGLSARQGQGRRDQRRDDGEVEQSPAGAAGRTARGQAESRRQGECRARGKGRSHGAERRNDAQQLARANPGYRPRRRRSRAKRTARSAPPRSAKSPSSGTRKPSLSARTK